jgi:hypothetical protein
MNFEDLQKTWQSQQNSFELTIDSDLLLREVKRNHRHFAMETLKCDKQDIFAGIFCSLCFVYFSLSSLNAWFFLILVPVCIYASIFLVIDRKIQKGKQVKPSESLDSYIQASLSQLDHRIWLVKNVDRLYLLPYGLSFACVNACMLWEIARVGCTIVWVWAFLGGGFPLFIAFVIIAIYRANQKCLRKELLPRKQELEQLLASTHCIET